MKNVKLCVVSVVDVSALLRADQTERVLQVAAFSENPRKQLTQILKFSSNLPPGLLFLSLNRGSCD